MQVSNDSPAVDYVKYFTEQFPRDLAQMAALRDELATRQGALSAAQAAIADREKAAQELALATEKAAALKAEAASVASEANAKLKAVVDKEAAFDAAAAQSSEALAIREKDVAKREAQATIAANSLILQQAELDKRLTSVAEQESALQELVKAFQDKVAALSA